MGVFARYHAANILLSETFRWSSLRAIGRSSLGRLTILMPFVGYLIVFNPSFVSFFQSVVPHEELIAPAWLLSAHSARLSFLYFGLLALGIGIGAFTLTVPEQIRNSSSAADYISEMERVWSPALVRTIFEDIIQRYLRLHDEDDAHPIFGTASPSFTYKPSSYLHELVAAIFRDSGLPYFPEDLYEHDLPGTMVMGTPYYFSTAAGHVLTDKIMQVTTSSRLSDRTFARVMAEGAVERRKEVFYLDYFSSDFQRYPIRILLASLFVIGFALLLVPTITTSSLAAIATFQNLNFNPELKLQ